MDKYFYKTKVDSIISRILLFATLICSSVIVFVVLFILIKGLNPFILKYTIKDGSYSVDPFKFLFGTRWFASPNNYQVGYIIIDTLYVVLLSLIIALPVSILSALFIAKIAPKKISTVLTYVVELLASIPSVIYGLFGLGVITKLVIGLGNFFGFQTAGGISTLSTVLVLAMMIIPTITLVSTTAIRAVKQDIINGSLALGATPTQTNFKIVLLSAKSGIFAGIILGVGRALGEATAVSLVAGNASVGPNFGLFSPTRTLTSTMLLGIGEASGLEYDIRFSVGLTLIVLILVINLILNYVKRRITL